VAPAVLDQAGVLLHLAAGEIAEEGDDVPAETRRPHDDAVDHPERLLGRPLGELERRRDRELADRAPARLDAGGLGTAHPPTPSVNGGYRSTSDAR
jgi:hypothetical protein